MATRHLCRLIAVQALHEWEFSRGARPIEDAVKDNLAEFGTDVDEPEFAQKLAGGTLDNLPFVDEKIKKFSSGWAFEELPLPVKNVLRLAIFELYFQNPEEVPAKVAINEAVDLGKSLCGDDSAKFINGVLASVYQELQQARTKQ